MKKFLKLECYRALRAPGLWICLLFDGILVGTHLFDSILVDARSNQLRAWVQNTEVFPKSVFYGWLGTDGMALQNYLFLILIPLVAAIPYGNSAYVDICSGYYKNLAVRGERKAYLAAKYAVVFLSGFAAALMPYLLDFLLCHLFLPSILPQISHGCYAVQTEAFLGKIFYEHPYGYVIGYMAIIGLGGGLFACLCLPVSFVLENRFLVTIFPFTLALLANMIFGITGTEYKYEQLLNPTQMMRHSGVQYAVFFAVLFLLSFGLYWWKGRRQDVL